MTNIVNTKDRKRVEVIRQFSIELVKSHKATVVNNWDPRSTWHNSKYLEVNTGREWVVYLSDQAWPGGIKVLEVANTT